MAYNKNNLAFLDEAPFNGMWHMWAYVSADAIATVNTAGYISNAKDMGMIVNDVVMVVDTTNHLLDFCMVAAIDATTGAADLTDGLRVTATNSD
jgi:hypothetical protein